MLDTARARSREKKRAAFTMTWDDKSVAVVRRATARRPTVKETHAGSLRLPRCGTGARYGASDSTRRRSSGIKRRSASSVQFLNVMMPLKDTYQPTSIAARATKLARDLRGELRRVLPDATTTVGDPAAGRPDPARPAAAADGVPGPGGPARGPVDRSVRDARQTPRRRPNVGLERVRLL